MTPEETGKLLGRIALYDNRKVDALVVTAWWQVVGDLPLGDSLTAVVEHFGESADRLMPVTIRQRVKAIRAARLQALPAPAPDPELTDDQRAYKRALDENVRRIADGFKPPKAISSGGGAEPSPEFLAARSPEDRDRVLAQTVPCPCKWCPALAGEPCRNNDDRGPLAKWHPSRLEAARAEAADREAS